MDPTAKAARRMNPGAYLSKGTDPEGGVLNKRGQSRADGFYKQLGMVSPAEQRSVPNNPLNFDSHRDAANPVVRTNLYGDWQQLQPGTAAMELPPTPPAARLTTQPYQHNEVLPMQEGLKMAQMQAQLPPSPIALKPNELVMNNQPLGRPGISGPEGDPLPAQPLQGMEDLMAPVRMGQAPLPPAMDFAHAPYSVQGDPAMASFPKIGAPMTSKGKPGSMPPVA